MQRTRPQVDEATSTVMLDTSGGAWISPAAGALTSEDLTRRCRHAVASIGPFVFVYGGLKGSQLLVGGVKGFGARCSRNSMPSAACALAGRQPPGLACRMDWRRCWVFC